MTINECEVTQNISSMSAEPYEIRFEGYSTEFISPEEIARALYKLEYDAFLTKRKKEESDLISISNKESPIYYDTAMGKFRLKERGF